MNKTEIDVAYLPLVDSAPFIVAEHLGFFRRSDLRVHLHKEVSWAIVRDKLAVGSRDAAQMLAPLPAMTTLGVSGMRVPLLTGLGLSKNGNGITLSISLWHQLLRALGLPQDHLVSSANVSDVVRQAVLDARVMPRKLTFAVVHGFSTHAILLRKWLRSMGLNPDADVSMIVVPPSQMVDSLQEGVIDGYCVGEPWNTLAIDQNLGIAATWGVEVWQDAPEKVLCVTEQWHEANTNTHLALRLALLQACVWLSEPDNISEAAHIMSAERYLNIDEETLLRALSGRVVRSPDQEQEPVSELLSFHGAQTNQPGGAAALELLDGCADLLGRPVDPVQRHLLATRCFRDDLYQQTVEALPGIR